MFRKHLALILCLAALPLVFVACGDDDDEEAATTTSAETSDTASGGGETVDITETEFALDPPDASAAAGEVTFAITNDGQIAHNLEIEGDGVEEVTETVTGGDAPPIEVDLQAGTYEFYCTVGGHEAAGMKGTLTVE